MSNTIQNFTLNDLRRAITIKEEIEQLQSELAALLGDRPVSANRATTVTGKKNRRMSAAGRARIAEGARKRWAKAKAVVETKSPRKRKKFSAETRAKMKAASKARWAKVKAGGKTAL